MWEIDVTWIEDWLLALPENDYDLILAALGILESGGPNLGRPLVDSITGSRIKNLKELRPGSSGRTEVRILFAFDPQRRAIMLLAGDKSQDWATWYRANVPIAEDRFEEHCAALGKEKP